MNELDQYPGMGVKALGNGRVGGYLVLFSTKASPDLAGEFFTDETDFDLERNDTVSVYYDHGFDKVFGKKKLGEGKAVLDKVGVWFEAQLEMRDEYEKALYELVKAGKMGWSSGTARHLVEREKVGKSMWIKHWPLGLDASLTPTPCEPRTLAEPIKSVAARASDVSFEELKAGMFHSEKHKALESACRTKMVYGYLDNHDEDKCYWAKYDDNAQDEKHFAIPYKIKGEKVTLGEETPVRKRTVYESPEEQVSTAKSLPLGEDLSRALAAVDGVVNRLEEVKALRAKENREISEASRQAATELRERLTLIISATENRATVSEATRAQLRLATLLD